MKKIIFKGCGVAIVTPMHSDGSINYDAYGKLIDFQIENGTDAIIACGTTGESATMSIAEHNDVIAYAIKRVNKRVPLIAGTGSNDTMVAVELSKHAEEMGADALLSVTPYYNKTSQNGLITHFNYIADRVNIPLILYNVPSRTGCNIQPLTYFELSKHPNIVATKEANSDFSAIAKTMALCKDELGVYSGNDDQALPLMALGGLGVISVVSNLCPRMMQTLTHLILDGKYEEARALNLKYISLMNAMFCDVNPIPIKEALNMAGFDAGPCRMPLAPLSDKNKMELMDLLRQHELA